MPGILPVYEPNNKKTVELGNTERKERIALIDAYWKYYNEGGARKPLKVNPGQPDDNVMLNLCAQGIDRLVQFFAPEAPTFILSGGMEREPGADGKLENVLSPEQEALNAFLEDNEFDHQIVDIALSGFISGHNFVRLFLPDNTDKISADNPPRLAPLDPRFIVKFWDVSNTRRTLFYRLTWQVDTGDEYMRQDIIPTWLERQRENVEQTPDVALGWEIIEYKGKGESGEYKEVKRDHWDYPFAPVIDWKNSHAPHEVYGASDLRHGDLNDAINFIASNTARIIKYHAHPKTVMIGGDPASIKKTSIDTLWGIPEGATVENLEMQSDLGSSLAYLDILRSAFFTQMHVVDTAVIKDSVGGLTNFGVRMLYKDMLDLTESKRSLYGSALAEMTRRAMVMMGYAEIEKPKDEWLDPLPSNIMELTNSLKVQKDMGVISEQTIQEQLQLDPVKEAERKDEQTQKATDSAVNVLSTMGDRGLFGSSNNPAFANGGQSGAFQRVA